MTPRDVTLVSPIHMISNLPCQGEPSSQFVKNKKEPENEISTMVFLIHALPQFKYFLKRNPGYIPC
jgi:hypothetical protein